MLNIKQWLFCKYLVLIVISLLATRINESFSFVFFLGILSPITIGFLQTIPFIIILILDYPMGGLADRWGYNKTFASGYLLLSVCYLGYFIAAIMTHLID